MRVTRRLDAQKGTKVNKRTPKVAKKENVPRRGLKKERKTRDDTLCVVL